MSDVYHEQKQITLQSMTSYRLANDSIVIDVIYNNM